MCVFSQCLLIYMCVDFNHYSVWILIITWWWRMSLYLLLVYLDFITWGSVLLLSLALVVRTHPSPMPNQTNNLKQNIYISSSGKKYTKNIYFPEIFLHTLYVLYMHFICTLYALLKSAYKVHIKYVRIQYIQKTNRLHT